jgi:hypothetical protein
MMTVSFNVLWWYLPAGLAIFGLVCVPQGPGGFVIAGLLWLFALGIILGHYLNF